jgi:hypothetical protein
VAARRVRRILPIVVATFTTLAAVLSAEDFRVTLQAAASLHGAPPTFFRSDVSVFNGSGQNETVVTATYRCGAESCGDAVQTFTIPPRQVRAFPDIVGTLFHAPETFGAIEFDSQTIIVVTSRLSSLEPSEPSIGMFVPGLKPEDAHPSLALTSLSHSAGATSGFRTNVGVYNPQDVSQPVLFSFFEASGVFLGNLFEVVDARRPLQLNDGDIFRRLDVAGDVRDFYCLVTGDGVHPLYAYASVIDRRSQDPIFIRGEDAAGLRVSKVTLPAAASLRGAAGTFFHSDARIWNASATAFTNVTARYLCFTAGCGDAEQSFLVAPHQMLVLDDVVASLFHASGTGGAIEFVSEQPLVVTSRLYTPDRSEPTLGMFVPALAPARAAPAIVMNGLSHPASSASGVRVNVGVFNETSTPQVVTYRLFDGAGNRIGQTSRYFAGREAFQINDIFASLGISAAVESAYCLVEGSEGLSLFAYAAVINNRSQDPIFVPGEDDPEKPPIVPLTLAGSR